MMGSDTDWQSVEVGNRFTIATKTDGSVWTWGWNDGGALGDGNGYTTDRYVPSRVGTATNWVEASAAGGSFTIARNSAGELFAWGDAYYGQLAQGNSTDHHTPVQIGVDTDWASSTTGDSFAAAIKSGGTLYTWGYNYYGQLGSSDTANKNTVTLVTFPPSVIWSQVAAGDSHTIALDSLGRIFTTGYNYYGQLGDGTSTNRSIFVQVGTDTDWTKVWAGAHSSYAQKTDGTIWGWGIGTSGQLGEASANPANPTGSPISKNVPTQIGTDADWVDLNPGQYYVLARRSDGSLWVWGSGSYGIGLGPNVSSTGNGSYSPYIARRIGLENNWEAASSSQYSSYFSLVVRNGQLFSWGYGSDGELGIGDGNLSGTYHTLQQVGNDVDWQSVSAGFEHSIALKDDGSLWEWGYGLALSVLRVGPGDEPYQPFPVEIIK